MSAKQTAAASTVKPAFDFDMFKSMGQFKTPGFDIEAMMATQRKNMEVAAAANQRAFEGMGAIMRRQAEIVRESTESAMKSFSSAPAGTPDDAMAQQADFAKKAISSFVENTREVFDMAQKTCDETVGLINDRMTATIDESKSAFAQK